MKPTKVSRSIVGIYSQNPMFQDQNFNAEICIFGPKALKYQ